MPLYEFTCQKCQQDFEVLGSYRVIEETPPPCDSCGSQQTARKISRVAGFRSGGSNDRASSLTSTCGSCSASPAACGSCGGG